MASKKTKVQIVSPAGEVVKSGTLKSTSKTPDGYPVIPEFEKPLVSVSISNPFKKILYWLDQIRKHQTTTLAFKISIPLIAIPVIAFAAYQIGKGDAWSLISSSNPSPKPSVSASPSTKPVTEISKAGTLKIAKGSTGTRYLLSLRNGTIIALDVPQYIDLSKYANKQVLVTGFLKDNGDMSVSDIAEIEVFNATLIPQDSPTPSPASAPGATNSSSTVLQDL